ncbi:heme-dependent oxidative N-demethylase family protein [Nguyenibacter vanlangensis]|uniref:DUF3445 domain-containing protein n=1 Tax=Nguyenibacter vanlangensis TaxID=1216886 RepID=A0A7Y7M5W0_9PROT|nr:DUF3445 domain-containing protein [Nguyenibacter vanlangensis]NVN09893.1 DUF3445 domain-containing protein [Nguyenibacter vanlangensis]
MPEPLPPPLLVNSDETILRFPYPFPEDSYMYSFNVEPHTPSARVESMRAAFDSDEHYLTECRQKARILAEDPRRCLILPHMEQAQWDFLELAMTSLAADYPHHFSLERNGGHWRWINRLLDIDHAFTFGDPAGFDEAPFRFIARQMQGDMVLLDQRDNTLWMDAGMVTGAADWSLKFDVGMSFHQWHAPVPKAHELGVFDRALRYLLMVRHEHPVRRLNWTMTVNPWLDTSTENYTIWGPDRATVTLDDVADRVHLRVELQALFRLPRSHALAFSIRTYLLPLRDIVRVPKWRARLHRVLRDLDPALSTYKGLDLYRQVTVKFLSRYDDGTPLSPGIQHDATGLV